MDNLKFNLPATNCTNRKWTDDEKAYISHYRTPNVNVECREEIALVTGGECYDVFITALANNVYVASQAANGRIYATFTLQDCLDTAALMVWEDH